MTVVDISRYRSVPCPQCLHEVRAVDLPAHVQDCPARRARMAHPSNWKPGA